MRISRELTHKFTEPKKSWYVKGDEQAQWIYLAERQFMGGMIYHSAGLRELRCITRFICRQYGCKPPTVMTYEMADHRYGFQLGDEIFLNLHPKCLGMNTSTLVHELAHYVCDQFYDEEVVHHGPEFAAIYGWILDRLNILPRWAWDRLCEDYNILQQHDGSPEAVRQ